MKKTLVVGSIFAVVVLVLASFSSVTAFQMTKSNIENISTFFDINKREKIPFDEKVFSPEDARNLLVNWNELIEDLQEKMDKLAADHQQLNNNTTLGNLTRILILTILAEFFIYLLLSHFNIIGRKIGKLFLIAVVINLITNPAFNLIYRYLYDNILVLETLVVILESFLILHFYKKMKLRMHYPRAVMISILANLFSYLMVSRR